MDAVVLAAMITSFATFWTSHVALAFGLASRGPWWRGPVAFVVLPLAPYWGAKERLTWRAVVWGLALIGYVALQIAARVRG